MFSSTTPGRVKNTSERNKKAPVKLMDLMLLLKKLLLMLN
jgi:hypothetical protein